MQVDDPSQAQPIGIPPPPGDCLPVSKLDPCYCPAPSIRAKFWQAHVCLYSKAAAKYTTSLDFMDNHEDVLQSINVIQCQYPCIQKFSVVADLQAVWKSGCSGETQ